MTPTPKLRFVERRTGNSVQYDVKVTERHGVEVCYQSEIIRVLQQWWHTGAVDYKTFELAGEWRDVPLEEE